MSLAIATITGHVGNVGQLKESPAGVRLGFTVATNSRKRAPSAPDGWADHATWWHVTVFGERARALAGRVTVGALVCVSGDASLDTWTGTRDGKEHTDLKIAANAVRVLAKGRDRSADPGEAPAAASAAPSSTSVATTADEPPF